MDLQTTTCGLNHVPVQQSVFGDSVPNCPRPSSGANPIRHFLKSSLTIGVLQPAQPPGSIS
jgi:hypothetical protein